MTAKTTGKVHGVRPDFGHCVLDQPGRKDNGRIIGVAGRSCESVRRKDRGYNI